MVKITQALGLKVADNKAGKIDLGETAQAQTKKEVSNAKRRSSKQKARENFGTSGILLHLRGAW